MHLSLSLIHIYMLIYTIAFDFTYQCLSPLA